MLAEKLKGFAKDSMLYGIGDGLGRVVALVMLPILSRAFVPADYGAIDLLNIGYYFLLMGVRLNVESGLQMYYYQYKGDGLKRLVSSANVFVFLFAWLATVIVILFAGLISDILVKSDELSLATCLLATCLPIELLFLNLLLLLRLQRKAILFCAVNIARVIITPLLTFLFVVILKLGIDGVFFAKLITLLLLASVTFYLERRQFSKTAEIKLFKKMFYYAIPGQPGLVIQSLMGSLPQYILAAYAPLTAVGLFGIAFRVTNVLNFYVNAFHQAWNPFAFANVDKPEEKSLYEIIFKVYALSLVLICLGLSLFGKEVLQILTPPEYHSAYLMVSGLTFYFGLRGLTLIFGTALYRVSQVKLTSYLDAINLGVFLPAAFILAPRYHAVGLIVAMDLASSVYFLCYLMATRRHFPFKTHMLQISIITLAAVAIVIFFSSLQQNIWLAIVSKGIVITIFAVTGSLMLMTSAEKTKLRQLANNFSFLTSS